MVTLGWSHTANLELLSDPNLKFRKLQHFLVSIETSYCSRNTLKCFLFPPLHRPWARL